MSVYGMNVVSGDYEGRVGEIIKLLNKLNLHEDDESTFIEHRKRIVMSTRSQETPTVFPLRHIMVFEDGRRMDSREATDRLIREWRWKDPSEEADYEEYSLQMLSDIIAPLITKGTFELVAVGHDATMHSVYHERLVIRADGSAERHGSYSHYRDGTKIVSERFDPSAKPHNRGKQLPSHCSSGSAGLWFNDHS
jgi:hypothetical protein